MEDRIVYLLKVAHDFLKMHPYMQEETILYDGAECDGGCLIDDIAVELGLDNGPYDYALPETEEYEEGLDG